MVMAVNNSPLLTAPVDVSGLPNAFRDGLKLRQEYDQRQQQKALNELMGISDFNERLAAAGQHKYAGALVPMVQEYEEARQKAALGNLKDSADIQKTFAETGKIGTEMEGESLKTAQGISDYISAAAVTQDPTAFGLKIGELHKRGLLTPAQTQSLLGMVQNDPQTAATLMQRMAMGNTEIAKTFLPSMQKIDLGDRVGLGTYNPLTGQYSELGDYGKGASPDAVLNNATSQSNNIRTTQASMYGADQSLAGQKYRTDADSQRQYAKMEWERQQAEIKAQKGKLQSFGGKVYVVYDDGTARPALDQNGQQIWDKVPNTDANGQPTRKLEANERKKIMELQDSVQSVESALQTLNEMEKLASDDKTYSGFGAGVRAKIASNLGFGGEEADNTVVYDNMATEQALTQLKAIFGGMPTEGERKILLDIQASASKTPAQRKAILANAKKAAMRRLQGYNEQITSIASGSYLQPGPLKIPNMQEKTVSPPNIDIQKFGDAIYN